MNKKTIRGLLKPADLPKGVSQKQVDAAIGEIAAAAKQRVLMAECGPFPGPAIPRVSYAEFFRRLAGR